MIDTIKDFILNGMMTLKSLLTLEWMNFKGMIFGFFGGEIWCAMYFAICCFFKTEPIMWVLSKLGFSKTKI